MTVVNMNSDKEDKAKKNPGPFDVMKSVFAAMIGVQSDENRERDFEQGKASHFIIGGIIFVVVFIIVLMNVVSSVVNS